MNAANERALAVLRDADPAWVGVEKAGSFLGLPARTVLHSGPPIAFAGMSALHRRGMIAACLFEGWTKSAAEAERLLAAGEVRCESAFDYATVGSGAGIVSPSVPLLIVENRTNGLRAGVFPAEGRFGGGFCGWGVYSDAIAANLRYLGDVLFAPVSRVLAAEGGFPLRDIMADGVKMGDENHSSQRAVDALFLRRIMPLALKCANAAELLDYFASTGRFFHNFGQAASRASLLGAENIPGCTLVTVAGGNGVTYGIKVSGTGKRWFTAPSPMIRGRYMNPDLTPASPGIDPATGFAKGQQPWTGDSSIVECFGFGGMISAAAPEVASWRGENLATAVDVTRGMLTIALGENPRIRIPALDFAAGPCGIDAAKVAAGGPEPVIDGGMMNAAGGWMGAGCARIPRACFTAAMAALAASAR